LRIKIIETKSGEYFEFEVRRDSRLWDSSSALKQVFDGLGLEQPGGRVRYALMLEVESGEFAKQIVSDVASAKNLTWADLGAKDGDEYLLESFPIEESVCKKSDESRPEGKHVIGIDFGTRYVAAAIMTNGHPTIIPALWAMTAGARGIPMCVAIADADHGGFLVGEPARRQTILYPNKVISSVKRNIGTDHRLLLANRTLAPEDAAALVLQKLKQTAEEFLNERVNKAIVAVPSCFDMVQRQRLREAAGRVGFDVLRFVTDATAISLAYALHRPDEQKVMVIDFGGGKLEVGAVEMGGGVVEVLATGADLQLGGIDIDRIIANHLRVEFKKENGLDIGQDSVAIARLNEAAEKAKIELSALLTTRVDIPFITTGSRGPKDLNLSLARGKLEELVTPLLQRCRGLMLRVLADANLQPKDIDRIILSGGSTRMPIVRSLIRELLGPKPEGGVDPSEAVAIGAAIFGAILVGKVSDLVALETQPISLGIEVADDIFERMIERNTTIPTRNSRVFTTSTDYQRTMTIHVLQGESKKSSQNLSLGSMTFEMDGRRKKGKKQVEIAFDFAADANFTVRVKDLDSGNIKSAQFPRQTDFEQIKKELLPVPSATKKT
jgi:molecular chaperone DnaK